jgi:hypothetical protein
MPRRTVAFDEADRWFGPRLIKAPSFFRQREQQSACCVMQLRRQEATAISAIATITTITLLAYQ